jgi:nucleoside-diphosphate kinase
MIMSNIEQTLSIIKPDAVERNLDNEIKEMFKIKGFSILKEKKIQIEKSEAEKFYKVHETKPFYNDLLHISFIRSYCCDDTRERECSIR